MTEIFQEDRITEQDSKGEPVGVLSDGLALQYQSLLRSLGVPDEDAARNAMYLIDPVSLSQRSEVEQTLDTGDRLIPTNDANQIEPDFKSHAVIRTTSGINAVHAASAAIACSLEMDLDSSGIHDGNQFDLGITIYTKGS